MRKKILLAISIVLIVSGLVVQTASAGDHVSGAIFTGLEDGGQVNKNIYTDKRDVYLLGGPGPNAPPGSAGLPDGNYYFQVTDPSGKKLLSEDAVKCREFVVEGGVFTEYLGVGRTWDPPVKGAGNGNGKNGVAPEPVPCHMDGWQHGMHDTGLSIDHNSLSIQLMPYLDTPNKGNVYKVWATPTQHFDGDNESVDNPGQFHGFIPRYSKTDNFKAKHGKPPVVPELKICKFEDTNGNGLFDDGEPNMESWIIIVTDPLGVTNVYYTGEDGCVVIDVPINGKYTVEEELPEDWHVTATIIDGEYVTPTNVVIVDVGKNHGDLYTVTFGNFEEFCVDGYKYDDLNGDGNWDIGEPGIEGWKVTLYRSTDGGATWTEYAVAYTDSNGYYMICVDVGGDFKIEEEMQTGWVPTSPTYFTFVGTSGVDRGPYNFFNFQCFYVQGYKYEDMNGDGDWDAGDTGIPGWHITLYKKNTFGAWQVFDEMDTDGSGHYSFYVCEAGEFKVEEEVQDGWIATAPTYFTFTATSGQSQTFDFFNFQLGRICGEKWYDLDRDGVKDSSEVTIEGFKIELWKDGSLIETVFTDGDGEYCFEDLGPGDYEVREIMPTDPDDYQVWAPTHPEDGIWYIGILTSGFEKLDADFGNIVEFTGGLTWGYWKTHTGDMSPPRDPAYSLLPTNPMEVDLPTPNGDYLIDSDSEAYWMFWGAGTGESPNCSDDPDGGKCRTLFRAQLLALHMNLLKFDGMGGTTFVYPGDDFDGQTVQDIYDAAIDLLTDGGVHDFTDFQNTLDRINNNGHYSLGSHVLIITTPPTPVY